MIADKSLCLSTYDRICIGKSYCRDRLEAANPPAATTSSMSSLALTITSPRLSVLPALVYFPIIASTSFSTTATPTEPDTPALFPPPRPMIKKIHVLFGICAYSKAAGCKDHCAVRSTCSISDPRALTAFKNTSTCTEPPAPTLLVLPAAPPLASRLCSIFCSYIHSAGESIISCSHFCYGLTLNYIHCRAYCYCHAICSCCCCAVLRSRLRWFSLASALTVRFLAVMFAAFTDALTVSLH